MFKLASSDPRLDQDLVGIIDHLPGNLSQPRKKGNAAHYNNNTIRIASNGNSPPPVGTLGSWTLPIQAASLPEETLPFFT